jgi:hypothetical protein
VYGDNFFSKASFTLQAIRLSGANALEAIQATDKSLLQKRDKLKDFEREFQQVCTSLPVKPAFFLWLPSSYCLR